MTLARRLASFGDGIEVETDPDILESYRYDQAGRALVGAGHPLAVVRPGDVGEIQQTVRMAAAEGVPVVPRGAGSGLSGGANAVDGALTLCLDKMDRILEVDQESLVARVEPGVINHDLRLAAHETGLDYTPDPASFEFSTLGGNVATNAGGLCCVKYGVTREAVLALDIVTATGELLRIGRPTRKGVAGYDLVSLLCGSEGSLGVIAGATLKLIPRRRAAATLAASFAGLAQAAEAIGRINRRLSPSLLELLDRTTISAVEEMAPQGLDTGVEALLFAQSDGGDAALSEVEAMGQLCDEAGATLVVTTDDPAEGRMMMTARKLAYPALERKGHAILDDVCVPLGRIADLLAGCEEIARRADLIIGTFGHAGDGNFHPTIILDPERPDHPDRAKRAFADLLDLAHSLGGTITGEHGVGQLKSPWLKAELGSAHHLHEAVKRAFDPTGVFNPNWSLFA